MVKQSEQYLTVKYVDDMKRIRRRKIIEWLRKQQSEAGVSVADTMADDPHDAMLWADWKGRWEDDK